MKEIKHRIGVLELRTTYRVHDKKEYLEIVKWNKNSCYTIAIFRENNEDTFYLESVGDRILMQREEWIDFRILVQLGFQHLKDAEDMESEK